MCEAYMFTAPFLCAESNLCCMITVYLVCIDNVNFIYVPHQLKRAPEKIGYEEVWLPRGFYE